MNVLDTLAHRSSAHLAEWFDPALRMMPSLRSIVIGCVDPRVTPEIVLGVEPGEVAVLRNVGGRVTPEVLDQLAMLRAVTQAAGGDLGAGWEIIVLQHTDCGITRLDDQEQLATYLGTTVETLPQSALADPRSAVAVDVAAVRGEGRLGDGLLVTGAVYDVASGSIEIIGG